MSPPLGSSLWWWVISAVALIIIYTGSYGALRWAGCIQRHRPMYAMELSGRCVTIDSIEANSKIAFLGPLYRPLIAIEERCRGMPSIH